MDFQGQAITINKLAFRLSQLNVFICVALCMFFIKRLYAKEIKYSQKVWKLLILDCTAKSFQSICKYFSDVQCKNLLYPRFQKDPAKIRSLFLVNPLQWTERLQHDTTAPVGFCSAVGKAHR